jgi:hypothetical protein
MFLHFKTDAHNLFILTSFSIGSDPQKIMTSDLQSDQKILMFLGHCTARGA